MSVSNVPGAESTRLLIAVVMSEACEGVYPSAVVTSLLDSVTAPVRVLNDVTAPETLKAA